MKNRFPVLFLILLTLLVADTGLCAMLLYQYYHNTCGLVGLGIGAVLLAAIIGLAVRYGRNTLRHVTKMNDHLEHSSAQFIESLPAPVAVIDEHNRFVWYNHIFAERISLGTDPFGQELEGFVKVDTHSLTEDGFAYCHFNGSVYNITAESFEKDGITFRILYFQDETSYYNLKKRADEAHPNVVILTLDNYDDIVQNAKESEKAQASVEIEKLIERFMNGTNGFIKRTSSNTFYAVLESNHLEQKINSKFKILDAAREIKIAGKFPLTFSIGVGQGASTLEESERIARQCLDMALGRGGDQAVVKTEAGYRFFGGVSKGVEKMSRAKTRIIANALQDLISDSGNIFIMGHRFGDLDAVGAACGMAGAVQLMGKNAFIAVDRQKNLAPHLIDMVEKDMGEGLFITPAQAVENIAPNDLLIIVDTHNKDFIESRQLYESSENVVVIDHHRKNVNFIDNAVIFHHEPYASSASEMVSELIQYFNFPSDERIPSVVAEALLAGIMLDTKNFVMRTGVRTFEAAAFLKKMGADTVAVKLLFSNSIDSYRRKTQIVASAKVHKRCAIATADFRSDDIRLVAPQAADELLNISDVDASFVLYKTGNTVNISARSLGAVNVQVIMEILGGGGHQTMAAAQLEDVSVEAAVKALFRAIDERCEDVAGSA